MKMTWMLAAFLLALPSAKADSCSDQFSGFFEWNFFSIPELTYTQQRTILGNQVIRQISDATPLHPGSALARKGFSGVGKCFTLRLDSPLALGLLLEGDFSITVLGLRQDQAAIWYLRNSVANELVSDGCGNVIGGLKRAALDSLAVLDTSYEDGYYKLRLRESLEPISRRLLVTADRRFVLSLTRLGRASLGKDWLPPELFQVCAFPL